jgi:Spy/CpxP family protein refolding chaperone
MKSIKAMGTKGRLITAASALMATLTLGVAVYVPAAEAVRAGEILIDGDFEEAMLKHFEKRFFKRIDATEAQQTELSGIFLNQMQGSRSQRETIRHKLIDLTDAFAADSATDDQIRANVSEVRTMREKLADSRVDTALKVRKVLTPEQRKTMADRIAGFLSGNSMIKKRINTMVD